MSACATGVLPLQASTQCPAQERPTAAHWCFESPCQLSIQGDLSELLNGPHFCGRDVDKVVDWANGLGVYDADGICADHDRANCFFTVDVAESLRHHAQCQGSLHWERRHADNRAVHALLGAMLIEHLGGRRSTRGWRFP
ncbi:hypothetical protein D9M68_752570 [compost metagenome]